MNFGERKRDDWKGHRAQTQHQGDNRVAAAHRGANGRLKAGNAAVNSVGFVICKPSQQRRSVVVDAVDHGLRQVLALGLAQARQAEPAVAGHVDVVLVGHVVALRGAHAREAAGERGLWVWVWRVWRVGVGGGGGGGGGASERPAVPQEPPMHVLEQAVGRA